MSHLGFEPLQNDNVVAVMGATGCGKSQFVAKATHAGRIGVSDSLQPEKKPIRPVRWTHPSVPSPIVLLDTPGFSDDDEMDHKTLADVLKAIATWLRKNYSAKKTLAGLILLHRITDNRHAQSNTASSNVTHLQQLTGRSNLTNVVLTSTMWSGLSSGVGDGDARENELKAEYWAVLLKAGASVARFDDTYQSAWAIVSRLPIQPCGAVSPSASPSTPTKNKASPDGRFNSSATGEIIIVLMGQPGSGKSQFIATATSRGNDGIGDKLKSKTDAVKVVRYQHPQRPGANYGFVDTPSFDDTHKPDTEILKMISAWLKKDYEAGKTVAGIVYLHRISDNRMAGAPLRNLQMFGLLTGDQAMHNVILATTMWACVKREIGDRREGELRSLYWKGMIDRGAGCDRFYNSYESAWSIVDQFTDPAKLALLIQDEMVRIGMKLSETSAGVALHKELLRLTEKQRELVVKLQQQGKSQNNPEIAAELEREYQKAQRKWKDTLDELEMTKIPFSAKLRSLFNWKRPLAKPVDLPVGL